jgi:hypothetical protein
VADVLSRAKFDRYVSLRDRQEFLRLLGGIVELVFFTKIRRITTRRPTAVTYSAREISLRPFQPNLPQTAFPMHDVRFAHTLQTLFLNELCDTREPCPHPQVPAPNKLAAITVDKMLSNGRNPDSASTPTHVCFRCRLPLGLSPKRPECLVPVLSLKESLCRVYLWSYAYYRIHSGRGVLGDWIVGEGGQQGD